MHRFLTQLMALGMLCIGLLPVRAETGDLRELLQTPGVHAIMRHALAPGFSDPAGFNLEDCNSQRTLSANGRDQAKRVGAKLRELGAEFTEIRTSQWCRCEETAQLLGFQMPVLDPVLNSFFEDRSTATAQTDALRAYLSGLRENQRVMLVTHQVNITALTGRGVGSGEVFLIRVGEGGQIEVLGNLEILP